MFPYSALSQALRTSNKGSYIPPHKKWRGIIVYPPNFECPSVRPSSVRPSVCLSALRFHALTSVPFDLFSSIFA